MSATLKLRKDKQKGEFLFSFKHVCINFSLMVWSNWFVFHYRYVFIEYANAAHAAEAVTILNNHKLDRQHTFTVNLFTDFKK